MSYTLATNEFINSEVASVQLTCLIVRVSEEFINSKPLILELLQLWILSARFYKMLPALT